MLPKALKSCPKSNKSPNLVTLDPTDGWTKQTKEEIFGASSWPNGYTVCPTFDGRYFETLTTNYHHLCVQTYAAYILFKVPIYKVPETG